jgi:hypothetical protein
MIREIRENIAGSIAPLLEAVYRKFATPADEHERADAECSRRRPMDFVEVLCGPTG